ncbi:hypothetical protein AB4Z21_09105, partial [Paenibacillus sp. MCAF20]
VACMALILVFGMLNGFASASSALVTLNSSTGAINFTYGSVSLALGNSSPLTGIRHLSLTNLWNNSSVSSSAIKKGHTTFGQTWGAGSTRAELETTVATKYDGTLTVSQHADSAAQGISGIQWGLIVPDSYDLIIPVLGGIRLTADSPDAAYGFQQFDYPNIWEAQMFIIQGEGGGMLVHANDDARFFKTLHVKHENGNFYVGMETHSPAPFQETTRAVSTDWRLRAYEGDWVNGATKYREWGTRSLICPSWQGFSRSGRRTSRSPF